ncbi:MAG: MBL fold metallo-hydrolase [Gemmatimonadales bacterium]|jgi:glyoxylase-like metal-dependent hydrolase (beta-lactamase superfamily II)
MATGELGWGVGMVVADNPGPLTLNGTRSYRIGARRAVLLDPGPDRPGGIDRLVELAGEAIVEWICLTHAHHDHAALASRAAEEFGASLAASPRTLARIGLEGRPLVDGDRIDVDGGSAHLDVLETPGHSDDSLTFCLQPARWLFTGDTVLGEGSTLVAPPDGNMSSYLASISRLISLRPERILPGHGPPVAEARSLLEGYRSHRLERERQIRDALESGANSVETIRRRVYPDLPVGLESAAEGAVRAHLAHLAERGLLPSGFDVDGEL